MSKFVDFITSPIFWAGVCLCIVFILVIIVIAIFNKSPSDPGSGVDPDVDPTIPCPLDPSDKVLVACDLTDSTSCTDCAHGFHSCYKVDTDHPYQFKAPSSEVLINVPDGTWCLPTKTTTLNCTEATGVPILAQLNSNENVWMCSCKYPRLFNSEGAFGDCLYETACSRLDDESKSHLICPLTVENPEDNYCKPNSTFLSNPTWNPTLGICDCKSTDAPEYLNLEDGQIKICVADSCTPGKKKGDDCDCGSISDIKTDAVPYKTYISCNSQTKQGTCKTGSQCIPDPCNPGGITGGDENECICTAPDYIQQPNSNSPTGYICENLCTNNGPCGNRGTCYLASTDTEKVALCTNCNYPWLQGTETVLADTGLCSYIRKSIGQSCNSNIECLSNDCENQYLFWGDKHCQMAT